MYIEVVGGLVGEIEGGEGGSPQITDLAHTRLRIQTIGDGGRGSS
jgi:hypothetical protein